MVHPLYLSLDPSNTTGQGARPALHQPIFRHSAPRPCTSLLLRVVLCTLALSAGHLLQPCAGFAQPPGATDLDEAVAKAQKEALLLKAEVEKAEYEKKIRDAREPKNSPTPLSGATTLDKVDMESHILSAEALGEIGRAIAGNLRQQAAALNIRTVILSSDTDVAALRDFQRFNQQATFFETKYNSPTNKALFGLTNSTGQGLAVSSAVPALLNTSQLLRSVIDVTSLFRTDTAVSGVAIAFLDSETILFTEMARNLRPSGIKLYSSTLSPGIPAGNIDEFLDILIRLAKLRASAEVASGLLRPMTGITQQNPTVVMPPAPAVAVPPVSAATVPAVPLTPEQREQLLELQILNTIYDKFLGSLTKAGDSSAVTTLVTLIRGAQLSDALKDGGHILQWKIQKIGGNNRTKKNLFTGGSSSHNGAAIVSYTLFNSDFKYQLSETVPNYYDYVNSRDISHFNRVRRSP